MSKKQIITLTDRAVNKLFDILKKTNNSNIEFYLKGGGCNGFNYHLVPTNNLPNKNDEIVKSKKSCSKGITSPS